jgi:hypothetical protein
MDPYLKIRTKSAVGAQKRAIPRVTTAERLRISLNVSDGEILVYDTDLGQYFVVTSSSNASFAPSALTADVPGRAVMSDGYFNEATVLAKFAAGSIPDSVLKTGATFESSVGKAVSYAKTTNGAQTALASSAGDRVVLILVTVTEAFAQPTGTKTAFTIGETGSASKFSDGSAFASGTVGQTFMFGGTLSGTKNLLVTGTAATGGGTGAVAITILALPAA